MCVTYKQLAEYCINILYSLKIDCEQAFASSDLMILGIEEL